MGNILLLLSRGNGFRVGCGDSGLDDGRLVLVIPVDFCDLAGKLVHRIGCVKLHRD